MNPAEKQQEIRLEVSRACDYVHWAHQDLNSHSPELGRAKSRLQEAKGILVEAIASIDGLMLDRAALLKNGIFFGPPDLNKADDIDPDYEAYQAARCGGCPQCGDDGGE